MTSAEARSRLVRRGPNLLLDHREQPLWRQFLARFKNLLAIQLLLPSAIPVLTGELVGFLIITVLVLVLVLVLFSVTLDFILPRRAGKGAASQRHSMSVRPRVSRAARCCG